MELTVDQALHQGVLAHNDGRLQEAERLYRAITQVQPKHPEANHNLGVLAVAVGKPQEAVPLFQLALDGDPKTGQFWISYVEVLINLERLPDAKQAIADARQAGVASQRLTALSQLLQESSKNGNKNVAKKLKVSEKRRQLADKKKARKKSKTNVLKSAAPPQGLINSLLGHYQSGVFIEAENLAASLTVEFPKHPFGWKALGLIYQQTGRLSESLQPMQKAVELSPLDAEAIGNLAVSLQELGRLDESEASCRQAIALDPGAYLQHNNLGNTLKKMGRFDEAVASFIKAIALKSEYAEAHYNLGNAFKELGRLNEAEASYRQAIILQENFAEAEAQLGKVCLAQGHFDEGLRRIRRGHGSIIFEADGWVVGC